MNWNCDGTLSFIKVVWSFPFSISLPRTLENLPKTSCPVLIIHAEDDLKVPTKLSKKLFEETLKVKGDISRILMDNSLGFESSHNDIYTVGEPLAEIVAKFWEGELDTEGETVLCTTVNIDSTCDL